MNLSHQLAVRLASRSPFHDRVERISAEQDGFTVRCDVTRSENLSCALLELELIDPMTNRLSTQELADRANQICERISYLTERLRAIEIDQRSLRALVRSAQPRRQGSSITYYELIATADHHTVLRRMAYDVADHQRQPIQFALTRDQFEFIIEDLCAATASNRN